MREILFRAWSEKEKCYRHNVGIYNGHAVRYGYQWYSLDNDVFDSNPEQFTGLVDRNGKRVFEGDIVRIEDFVNAVVKWREDIACWTLQGYIIGNTWGSSMLEVIGNIHDNPDLMKEKTK